MPLTMRYRYESRVDGKQYEGTAATVELAHAQAAREERARTSLDTMPTTR